MLEPVPVLPAVTATYLGGLQCSIRWGWSHLAHGLLAHYALALLEGKREALFPTSLKGRNTAALFSAAPTKPDKWHCLTYKVAAQQAHAHDLCLTLIWDKQATKKPATPSQDMLLSFPSSHPVTTSSNC